jgi:hypothetical protein
MLSDGMAAVYPTRRGWTACRWIWMEFQSFAHSAAVHVFGTVKEPDGSLKAAVVENPEILSQDTCRFHRMCRPCKFLPLGMQQMAAMVRERRRLAGPD